MRAVLPLPCKTSLAYAEAVRAGADPVQAAEGAWVTRWTTPQEDSDPEHRIVYGDVVDIDTLLAEQPWPDESGAGWAEEEASRLGRCSRRLWDRILAVEEVEQW
jgi:exonuclease V gamma subunit